MNCAHACNTIFAYLAGFLTMSQNLKQKFKYRLDSGKTLHNGKLSNLDLELPELAYLLLFRILDAFSIFFLRIFGNPPPPKTSAVSTDHPRSKLSRRMICSILLLKTLLLFAKPFENLGNTLEYYLNIVYANHGLKNTLQRCLFKRDSLTKPRPEDDNYYSLIGLLDPRQDLLLQRRNSNLAQPMMDTHDDIKSTADLCIMASKLSYENEEVIKRVVKDEWKMNFVKYYNCWNEYLESYTTQAFIFTDKEHDASAVVIAFRGTQPFNVYDWCTDFDFCYYKLHEMGKVHVGFLEALGLGNRLRKDSLDGKINTFMQEARGKAPTENVLGHDDKKILLAYDAIYAKIRDLMTHNPGAKLYVTGHSLGGALATLFTGLLLSEDDHNTILKNLGGIFTFGQPRVGDSDFAAYMEKHLCNSSNKKYFRVVYQCDIVTRVPFDDHLLQFKHIAPCHYYHSVSDAKTLKEEPHKNMYSVVFRPASHLHATKQLIGSLSRRFVSWSSEESKETVLCLLMRFGALLTPGICAHLPTNYVDAIRNTQFPLHMEERSENSRSSLPARVQCLRY